MPLTLVTGPANAEKAGFVLDRLRAALDRDPILVVPTSPDVLRYREELGAGGFAFGARVETFDRLLDEIARRTRSGRSALGVLARERVAAAAASRAGLRSLAASAATPGFAAAACRLFDELGEQGIDPARWTVALRAWASEDGGRSAYAEELAALYRTYRSALKRVGRPDRTLAHAAAIDALKLAPAGWGETPVLLYGFDDLSVLQRETVLALGRTDAAVVVSLAYEPGRHAFAARGETFFALQPHADHVSLPARDDYYAPWARDALHRLERGLFEDDVAPAARAVDAPLTLFDADPVVSAAAHGIVLLEGGGERAEMELVAAEVARLIAEEGMPPEEIAVVLRSPDEAASLVAQVFGAYGIPIAMDRRAAFGHTPLGRGLVALLRAATGGAAEDLLAWLRTPGFVRKRDLVDQLEREVRLNGARSAGDARRIWNAFVPEFPLDAIDRVADANRRGPRVLLPRLADELSLLFAAPHRREAPVLDGAGTAEARVLATGRRALEELAALAEAQPGLVPDAPALAALVAGLEVRLGERAAAGAVQVADPLTLRARRVRALFACRLQEGTFPAPARPEPFIDDTERRRINAASGLRLRAHEDALAAERYLFYATVTRPEARLYLSWHTATDEGDPAVRSAFVDDVEQLFDGLERRRRDLGAVDWPEGVAPTERERLRGEALAAPRAAEPTAAPLQHPEVLASLRDRPAWSASGLEVWAGCPTRWFVERLLNPEGLEPDPEAMVRGTLAHAVLERALRHLVNGGGLTTAHLPEARDAVRAALDELHDRFPMSTDPSRRLALRRRLEADLLRYVESAARSGTSFDPDGFEVKFEGLEVGEGLVIDGKIDRIDVRRGTSEAIVYDYKGKTAYPGAKWVEERRFQLALYALAARRLLGLEPVGALYQPLGAPDQRPRGALRRDADPDLALVAGDRLDDADFDALVDEAVAAATAAAREAKAGALEARPESCAWQGGCRYPTICRCEAA